MVSIPEGNSVPGAFLGEILLHLCAHVQCIIRLLFLQVRLRRKVGKVLVVFRSPCREFDLFLGIRVRLID